MRGCNGRYAFTLVEVMVALVVFFLLASVTFNFFIGGSKYAGKGAWRVHAVSAMRNGLRILKERLEATSYPTVVRLDNYSEDRSATFGVNLVSTSFTSYGTGTCYTYEGATNDFLRFVCCHPLNETDLAAPTGGEATRIRLSLVPSQHRNMSATAPASMLLDLQMTEDTGTIGSNAGIVIPPTFATGQTKTISIDVESVDVIVPASSPAGSILHLRIHCRDPINGRMLLAEEAMASVNVEVIKP